MARGQVIDIANQSAQLISTLSREEQQSLDILNPNDGVVYIKLNGPATNQVPQWDWKLPSQSYGRFPGPWTSLGLYYLDQSGSGAQGELNVYDDTLEIVVPQIVAIGRAIQVAGTTMDITQGNQPQSPPANTTRLWADTSGNLHHLSPTGTDAVVVDSLNVASYTQPIINATNLGGDLFGTIANAHIHVVSAQALWNFGSYIEWNDPNHKIYSDSSNTMYFDEYGVFQWRCSSRSFAGTMQLDANGNLSPASSIFLGSNQWIFFGAGNTNGIISDNTNLYIRTNGVVDIQNTAGSLTTLNVATLNASSVVQTQNQYQWTADGSYSFVSGGYIYFRSSANGIVIQTTGGSAGGLNCGSINTNSQGITCGAIDSVSAWIRSQSGDIYLTSNGDRMHDGGDNNNWVFYGPMGSVNFVFQHRDGSWMGTQAANFQTMSDATFKKNIVPLSDEECLARIRQPISPVTWVPTFEDTGATQSDIGFTAQDMVQVVPEVVYIDQASGNPEAITYGNLTALLWGALRIIDQRLTAHEESFHPGGKPIS